VNKGRARNLKILTRAAVPVVLARASSPLPSDPSDRVREGRRRLEATAQELFAGHKDLVSCDPIRLLEMAFQVAQVVYSGLKSIGVIKVTGSAGPKRKRKRGSDG
jgi:hypothetical protein